MTYSGQVDAPFWRKFLQFSGCEIDENASSQYPGLPTVAEGAVFRIPNTEYFVIKDASSVDLKGHTIGGPTLNDERRDAAVPNIDSGCRELQSVEDWERGWAALRTLRPNLSLQDFIGRKQQLERDGYHLIGLFRGGEVVCVASYTISPHPVYCREMIIHDMSTLEVMQATGCGSELLQHLDHLAVSLGCQRTFVASATAAAFYEKNGYTAHATALKKMHTAV